MSFARRELPTILLTACGVLMLLAFFTPFKEFTTIKGILTSWTIVVAATSTWLGFAYMSYAQYRMYQRNPTRIQLIYFITPFAFFSLFLIVGVSFPGDVSSPQYLWLLSSIYQQVGATIYAVMFFTLASSAYRTFTVASIESIALLLGGVIYTLRQIPLFPVFAPWLVPVGEWILLVPNVGGGRGAVICAAMAALVVGIRTLWGKEMTMVEA
jgi:hypothetical protein